MANIELAELGQTANYLVSRPLKGLLTFIAVKADFSLSRLSNSFASTFAYSGLDAGGFKLPSRI